MAKPAIADTSSHEVKYPLHSGTHPLDPLTYAELEDAVRIIHESGHFHSDMRFVTITATDPPRDLVRTYEPGTPYERMADVVLSDGRACKTIEATVSLSQRRVLAFGPTRHQGQAPITPDEFVEVEIAAKMNNQVADALRKRGLDLSDRNLVCVDPWSVGYFGADEDPSNRVARATFYLRKEADDMQYAHPIENLNALVDLYRKEVIKIEDAGAIPVPGNAAQLRPAVFQQVSRRPEAARDFTTRGTELQGQRLGGHVAAVEVSASVSRRARGSCCTTSATMTSTRAASGPSFIVRRSSK